MKKTSLFFLAFIFTACAPQVTVTPEVTVTVTASPIPAPTLHPQFLALQEQIANSGGRFSLRVDGLIYDGETPIPGVTVATNGTMTITINGETITLDPADVSFDDEKGISIKDYELTDVDDDGEKDTWVEAIPMSELDQQIFDAAPEIEGVEKEMHNLWGVVGVDENGEIVKYWDYYEYNYDRGDWREVVGEENGHLVVLDSKGEEQIVYPERITINVNGEELTLNTTARNYLENRIPDTPGAKLEIAKELIRLSDEGHVLPKLAEDGMTLKDFWMKEKFNKNAVASEIFSIHSTDWEKQRPDQLPSAFVLFAHIVNGKVVEGAYDTFTLIKQSDKTTSGYWATVVDPNKRMPHAQQILDHDIFKTGGRSIVAPDRFISQVECEKWLGVEMVETCSLAMADVPVVMQAFRSSVESGMIDPKLMGEELTVLANMMKVAE